MKAQIWDGKDVGPMPATRVLQIAGVEEGAKVLVIVHEDGVPESIWGKNPETGDAWKTKKEATDWGTKRVADFLEAIAPKPEATEA